MLVTVVLMIVGLVLVVVGADFLVDGSSSIARKLGISEFVIGLTIVGFGTSCPELVVSVKGALMGNPDIAVGNVVGSNIFNTLLILSITSLISPLLITRENAKRDIPIMLCISFIFVFCAIGHSLFGLGNVDGISRLEGVVFLMIFAVYMYLCFKFDKNDAAKENAEKKEDGPGKSLPVSILLTALGLASLIGGGDLFVNKACDIARVLGISDKFIAVTFLAGGTSLPELAASIVAAAKGRGQLALGNIIGSNVFNILLILGIASCITSLGFNDIGIVDMIALILSAILLFLCSYTGRRDRVDRFEAVVMLLVFIAYYIYLFIQL